LGLVADMGRKELHIEFWMGKLKERDYTEDLEVDGNNIEIDFKKKVRENVHWFHVNQNSG